MTLRDQAMIYTFNQYELDTSLYELRHVGEPVHILPKTFDLLAYLVQHHGQTLTKGDLHSHLWPDEFVSESALVYHIAEARKSVGDSGQSQQLIKTIYGRGYRFIAPVEEHEASSTTASETEAELELALAVADDEEAITARVEQPVERIDERRQLTVLWCSLVAASNTGSALDPEDRHESMRHAQSVCREVIEQLGGNTVPHLSHGLLAYYGYPTSREDDVHQAVRTGLRLVQAVQRLSQDYLRTHGIELTARVALHNGIVVIEAADRDNGVTPVALGDIPHMAAQLASLASPNTVVLSASTLRLVEGYFLCDNLGDYFVEELAQSTVLHEVLGESGAQSRIEAAVATRLTPFVGREQELGLLQARWEQAQAGRGQVVLLSGDAGIGKSRLVHTFYECFMDLASSRIEGRCTSSTQHHAFYPIVEHFQRLASFNRTDSPDDKRLKLAALHEQLGLGQEDMDLLAASLFALKRPDQQPVRPLALQKQNRKILTALLTWLLHEVEQRPVCLVIEDLHWADPSTLDLLGLLIEHAPASRLLILLTFRSEFELPWEMRSYMASLALNRLTNPQVDQIILEVTQGKPLPIEIMQQLQDKTDGVPLFVEEMTRMVIESGLVKEQDTTYALVDALEPLTVPSTLHDSLMARLDRLGAGKRLVQLASAIGREFSYDLIRAVPEVDEVTLHQALSELVDAEMLYQRGLLPKATFLFKHALIQEAAYQSLLRSTRRQYHHQIAQVLEAQFPETRESQPELLAHHYTEAGLHQASVDYWRQAARQAFERTAFFDAEAHVQQGLLAVARLIDDDERAHQELALQTLLAVVARFTKSYDAPEVGQALRRAQELCEQAGELSQLFDVIRGLWLSYVAQAQLPTALELGERLMALAQQLQEPALILEAHRDIGASLFFLGQQTAASRHFAQGRQHDQTQPSSPLTLIYGPGGERPFLLSYQAWNQWLLGYPDQALETMEEALRLFQQHDRVQNLPLYGYGTQSFTIMSAATLHQWRREPDEVRLQIEAYLVVAEHSDAVLVQPRRLTLEGWALAQAGQEEAGIELIRRGMADYRAQGAVLTCPYMLAMIAESCGAIGEMNDGLDAIAEALDLAQTYNERWWEADLYRLRAELLLLQDEPDALQAVDDLQRALAVAREQEAKSLELRAAVSLARLLRQQGHTAAAYDCLAPVYNWFTEGFGTADLQEAKALLADLA